MKCKHGNNIGYPCSLCLFDTKPMAKPPLGPMPHKLWLEHRAKELAEAIGRNTHMVEGEAYIDRLREWVTELDETLLKLRCM